MTALKIVASENAQAVAVHLLAPLDQVARVEVEALVVEAHPEAVVARVAVVEAVTKSVLRFSRSFFIL